MFSRCKAMLMLMVLLSFLQINTASHNDESVLDIAAFNVQLFGVRKVDDTAVAEKLVEIIRSYDVVLIQEIRDSSGNAIKELLKAVNAVSESHKYVMVISPRLGRTMSKEQYAFIYREDWVTVKAEGVYNDVNDVFEREPYYVLFSSSRAAIQDFVVLGIHTKPDDAAKEIDALGPVYTEIKAKWKIDDVVLMGDFNGGCSYANDWSKISIATDKSFYWLIDDSQDTTVKTTECPYDRIVVRGDELIEAIIPESPGAFRFDYEMGLSSEFAEKISDHYPVHFQIVSQVEKSSLDLFQSFTLRTVATIGSTRRIYSARKRGIDLQYDVESLYKKSGGYQEITISKDCTFSRAVDILKKMHRDFFDIMSNIQVQSAIRRIKSMGWLNALGRGYGHYYTLYDYYKNRRHMKISITCDVKTLGCDLGVTGLLRV